MPEPKSPGPDTRNGGSKPRKPAPLARMAASLRNGIEIARFGGVSEREPEPFEIAHEGAHYRLRRYFPDRTDAPGPPVILVPPLMLSADVWDVARGSSAVAALREGAASADPWVVDFGSPEAEEGGLERTLTDHVLAVVDAVTMVREATGRDVHLMGYSQGGMFAYQAAAYRRSEGLASLVTFGSPVDLHGAAPAGLPMDVFADAVEGLGRIQSALLPSGIPSWATRIGFQLLDPIKTVQQRVDFVRRLYDREALQQRDGMRRFMNGEGWVAFPGPALRDVAEELVAGNRMQTGGFVIGDQTVSLSDIRCPILVFVGTNDTIAPPATVRSVAAAAPHAEAYQSKLVAGHFGLVVGSRSQEETWPTVAAWLRWRDAGDSLPEQVTRLSARPAERAEPTLGERLVREGGEAIRNGRNLIEDAAGWFGERAGRAGRAAGAVAPQIGRLARLADIRADTRVSLGRMLAERARETPDDTFFLFEGRAHDYGDANTRVDHVVRGFLHCGVRHGQFVGVLMETRPSAVAATAALSRLGAVPVLLRPDVPLARQFECVALDHLLADPEHGAVAREAFGRDVLVLGGGGAHRELPAGLIDMEAIDPGRVWPPDWYEPDPGTAAEVGLVLLSGDEERLGVVRVTNRRLATSAYGTATACALTSRDTVYCCSPTHHATGILVCVGGALASGARLAMTGAFAPALDPDAFWSDVRRYGVSVVFYTGAMLRTLVNAPVRADEQQHPIRLFAGSGMPEGVWRRVESRLAPARVVEFFASSEGNAVLVNLSGDKTGSLGQPLPGAADLTLASFDLGAGALAGRPSGLAGRAGVGEAGLLLARVDPGRGEAPGRPLRGVFEAGDAWHDTGELVLRDVEGDYWHVDSVADVIRTSVGAVPTVPAERALARYLAGVDLAAVYGARVPGLEHEVVVAALTLQPGTKLDPVALGRIVTEHLDGPERPAVVRVVAVLPMTAGHRVRKGALREQGLGLEDGAGESFWYDPGASGWVPLARADLPAWVASLSVR